MSTTLRYSLGAMLTIPLLPLLYLQGKKVKNTIPDLPEAVDPKGVSGSNSNLKARVLVVGESTMAGVGVSTHSEGFAGTLAEELADKLNVCVDWTVYAKSGITIGRINNELLSKVSETDWDLIVIGIGGNDAFKLNYPLRWKSQAEELIEALRNRFGYAPIVFANMPPIKEFPAFTPLMKWTIGNLVEILGEVLEEVVDRHDKVYYSSEIIKIQSWSKKFNLSSEVSCYFSDGVHPSKLTYQTLARQLARFIAEKSVL